MKRIFSVVLIAALLMASVSACGGDPDAAATVTAGSVQEPPRETAAEPGPVDLAAFSQAVLTDHDFPGMDRLDPADGEFGAIMLEHAYPGLKDLDLAQLETYMAKSSFSGVELALIQVRNTADAARVKEIFQARIDDMSKPGNYADAAELWQHCARVAASGSYVILVNHEDSDAIVSDFNGLFP